jgi:formate dehydrogenase subunit gamma
MKPRLVLLACWMAVCASLGGAVAADPAEEQATRQVQQPLNNAPVWREVRSGESHTTQVRGRETGVLIQASGETWRQIRNGPVTLVGGVLLIFVPIAIYLFYRKSGPIKVHEPLTGRKIERFTRWERIVHWSTAISFVILAITGILMLFGKHFLIPVIGYGAFSWLAAISKNLHNFVGPLFIFAVACMFFTYLRDNLWIASIVHGVGALIFVLASFGHIYMGTIGTEGAYEAMRSGMVDETWAKEHHELWYREVKSGRGTRVAPAHGAQAPG